MPPIKKQMSNSEWTCPENPRVLKTENFKPKIQKVLSEIVLKMSLKVKIKHLFFKKNRQSKAFV